MDSPQDVGWILRKVIMFREYVPTTFLKMNYTQLPFANETDVEETHSTIRSLAPNSSFSYDHNEVNEEFPSMYTRLRNFV